MGLSCVLFDAAVGTYDSTRTTPSFGAAEFGAGQANASQVLQHGDFRIDGPVQNNFGPVEKEGHGIIIIYGQGLESPKAVAGDRRLGVHRRRSHGLSNP